jgi:acetylornithine deacetylase
LIDDGVNAINYSAKFIKHLESIQKNLKKTNYEENFYPKYPTINIGTISGGIAVNIIPKTCEIEFEIRDTPKLNTEKLLKKITDYLSKLEKKMKTQSPLCSIKITQKNNFPPLQTNKNKEIIALCLNSLKANSLNTVSFGTEAGVFNDLGFQTVVCGPGSIKQAHKPDEFIEKKQLIKCHSFLEEILKKLY